MDASAESDVDVADTLGAGEVETKPPVGGEVGQMNVPLIKRVVLKNGESRLGGSFLDPIPVLWNVVDEGSQGGDLKTTTVFEDQIPIASPNGFCLPAKSTEGVDPGGEANLIGSQSVGDHRAVHVCDRSPNQPGQAWFEVSFQSPVQRASTQGGIPFAKQTLCVDGQGN